MALASSCIAKKTVSVNCKNKICPGQPYGLRFWLACGTWVLAGVPPGLWVGVCTEAKPLPGSLWCIGRCSHKCAHRYPQTNLVPLLFPKFTFFLFFLIKKVKGSDSPYGLRSFFISKTQRFIAG